MIPGGRVVVPPIVVTAWMVPTLAGVPARVATWGGATIVAPVLGGGTAPVRSAEDTSVGPVAGTPAVTGA